MISDVDDSGLIPDRGPGRCRARPRTWQGEGELYGAVPARAAGAAECGGAEAAGGGVKISLASL
jgi:hypothetical protein